MKTVLIKQLVVGIFIFLALPVLAADFDPDYLISDSEITDYNSMDKTTIQDFLNKKPGTLKNYLTVDKEGHFKTATETFYESAQKWMINPKYLLVLVQKEMGLLNDPSPKQTQYDWATGYGCFDNQTCDTKYKGFYKQVNSAAAQTRYYLDNINEFNFRPGRTYSIDNTKVTIKNTATAGLYNYTPHIHGNKLFWNLWNNYFAKKWPDGAVLYSTSTDKTYSIYDGKKREIVSKSVLLSLFDPNKIVEVNQADLDMYEDGVPIKYHNFDLISTLSSGTASTSQIYMITGDQKRRIENWQVFKSIGWQEDEIVKVTQTDLSQYKNGPNITQYTIYPAGALLQDKKTGTIYYVINGRKKPVINQEILEFNFHGLPIRKAGAAELNKYRSGNPVTLPDGELIKSKSVNTVYVISNGKRLPIFNSDVFKAMNYKWENVMVVKDSTINVHPLGQAITGDW